MAHSFLGFSVSNRKISDDCVIEATRLLSEAHGLLISLQRKRPTDLQNRKIWEQTKAAYERWFGKISKDRLTRATEVISVMDFVLSSGRVKFTYNRNCNPTTNAVAFTPPGGWNVQSLKQSLKNGRFEISLCPRFFQALPQNDKTVQSRVGTFCHELSHIVGNTVDVAENHLQGSPINANPAGFTFYGRDSARILADRFPNFAVENAENYGFYSTWLIQEPPEIEEDLGISNLFD